MKKPIFVRTIAASSAASNAGYQEPLLQKVEKVSKDLTPETPSNHPISNINKEILKSSPSEPPQQPLQPDSHIEIPTASKMAFSGDKFYYQKNIDEFIKRSSAMSISNPGNVKTVEGIKRVSIMDFDNTLFCSPLPNSDLWDSKGIGMLKGDLGWFLEPKTLQEPYLSDIDSRWISPVEKISRAEINRSDTLSVLLTGRSDYIYHEIIRNLLKSRDLNFDLIVLKENGHVKWDPQDNIFTYRAKNMAGDLENLVFVLKESNTYTFDYKMGVIHHILTKFPNIDSVYMWDDRQNHCERMQNHLNDNYVRTNRIKESIVYKQDQRTLYMDPQMETKLINDMVLEYNHNIELDFEHTVSTEADLGGRPECQYLNSTLAQTLKGVTKKRKKNAGALDKLRIEPVVLYSCVSLESTSTQTLNNIFSVPEFWRPASMGISLGRGLLSPKTLATRFGDYSVVYDKYIQPVVSLKDGKMKHGDDSYPDNLISYSDKVVVEVDGIGFIPGKVYGLRVSSTIVYPGSRSNSRKDRKGRPIKRKLHPRGLTILDQNTSTYQDVLLTEPPEYMYNSFIPISFNEARGARQLDAGSITKFIAFDNLNENTIKDLDRHFATDLLHILDLTTLLKSLQVDPRSRGKKVLFLEGTIEPSIRKTFISDRMLLKEAEAEAAEKAQIKSAISVGSLILEIWGNLIEKKQVGIAKKLVIEEMEKQSVSNVEENRDRIFEMIKSIDIQSISRASQTQN